MSVRKNIIKETHLKKERGGGRKEGAGGEGNTYLGIRIHPFVSSLNKDSSQRNTLGGFEVFQKNDTNSYVHFQL